MIQQSTTWYNNLLHDTAIYYMIQQSTTWYSNLLHDTAIYYMIQHSTTWYSNLLHDTAIYYMIQQSTTWYRNLLHDTAIYYMIQKSTTWYSNLLHDTTIYYMIQQSTTWYSNLLHDTTIYYMIQQSTTWYSNLLHESQFNLGIWCFFPKHMALSRKCKTMVGSESWLARNHDNVSAWSDMSIWACFFSLSVNLAYWSSTKRASHFSEYNLFSSKYSWTFCHIALSNNQSITKHKQLLTISHASDYSCRNWNK